MDILTRTRLSAAAIAAILRQLQQEKKRLREELERSEQETRELRQELDLLRSRLEETEWSLCQKSGETALLKSQLKETQGEQTTKGHEVISLKNEIRELRLDIDNKNKEISMLQATIDNKAYSKAEIEQLNSEVEDLRTKLELFQVVDSNPTRDTMAPESENKSRLRNETRVEFLQDEIARLSMKLEKEHAEWERERLQWAQEKEKVLRYQRQLQLNYVQMYRLTHRLDGHIQNMSLERVANKKSVPEVTPLNAIRL